MSTKDFRPSSLPFLPGHQFSDPTITRYHKTQVLNYKDGSTQEKTTAIEENVDEALLEKMRTGQPLKLTGVP